jgi:hypothetical protein
MLAAALQQALGMHIPVCTAVMLCFREPASRQKTLRFVERNVNVEERCFEDLQRCNCACGLAITSGMPTKHL